MSKTPKKMEKPSIQVNGTYVAGGIHVKGNYINGDQINYHFQDQRTAVLQ